MKKISNIIRTSLVACMGLTVLASCTDDQDWSTDNAFDRLFHATDVAVNPASTSADVTFKTTSGVEHYIIEVSTDSLTDDNQEVAANSIVDTVTTSPATITGLNGDTDYFLRIKAQATGEKDSKWVYYTRTNGNRHFHTEAEQIFYDVSDADRSDTEIDLSWIPNSEVTNLEVQDANGQLLQNIALDDSAKANGKYAVTGLTASTSYTFVIYNNDAKRGTLTVSTTAAVPAADYKVFLPEGTTEITTAMLEEYAVTAKERSGSETNYSVTIGIPAGSTVNVHGIADDGSVSKIVIPDGMSVTFFGLSGGSAPTLNLPKEVGIDGSHAYINFENVNLANGGANYFINQANACTIGTLGLKDVTFDNWPRSLIRLQGGAAKSIDNLNLENVLAGNEGSGGYALLYFNNAAYSISHISIKNSSFYNLSHSFMDCRNAKINSIDIDHCTFYNIIGSGRYFIDAQNVTAAINLTNSIFGKTASDGSRGMRGGGDRTITGVYFTSDFVLTSNAFSADNNLDQTAADVFTDPDHQDFTVKVDGLTAGDPRWIK